MEAQHAPSPQEPYTVYTEEEKADSSDAGAPGCCATVWIPFIYTPCQAVLGLVAMVQGLVEWNDSCPKPRTSSGWGGESDCWWHGDFATILAAFVFFAATLQTIVNCQMSRCADQALTPAVIPSCIRPLVVVFLAVGSAASLVLSVLCLVPSIWGGWRSWECFWLFVVSKWLGVFAYKIRQFDQEDTHAPVDATKAAFDQAPLMAPFNAN